MAGLMGDNVAVHLHPIADSVNQLSVTSLSPGKNKPRLAGLGTENFIHDAFDRPYMLLAFPQGTVTFLLPLLRKCYPLIRPGYENRNSKLDQEDKFLMADNSLSCMPPRKSAPLQCSMCIQMDQRCHASLALPHKMGTVLTDLLAYILLAGLKIEHNSKQSERKRWKRKFHIYFNKFLTVSSL